MTDRLRRYREIRDFDVTPEPRGRAPSARKRGLRYYIQRQCDPAAHSTDIRGAFSAKNIPVRLRELKVDPWAGYDSVRQNLTDAMRKALATWATCA